MWLNGKESTCPCRRHGFDPWSRTIPPDVEQLSPWATTTEAQVSERLSSATREATTMRSLCTATREKLLLTAIREKSLHAATKTQQGQMNNHIINFFKFDI